MIFAEAKLHKDFTAALASAFASMTDFHNSATKDLEINYFLNTFPVLNAEQQKVISSYVEGENKDKCQQVHVCLIGYTWKEYECLKDSKEEGISRRVRQSVSSVGHDRNETQASS